MKPIVNIFWFRRDLRLNDNAALYHALRAGLPVQCIFIFDRNILDKLDSKDDQRVVFIHDAIQDLGKRLEVLGAALKVFYDFPENAFHSLIDEFSIHSVFCNRDYEPYAIQRDESVKKLLEQRNIGFRSFKDQVIFDQNEVLKEDGSPYTVFTPYSRKWKSVLRPFHLSSYPNKKYAANYYQHKPFSIPSLPHMGFKALAGSFPENQTRPGFLRDYVNTRDYPGIGGTSRLGIHLRFGTISVRSLALQAQEYSDVFLNELIWRDFYHMILWHFPKVGNGHCFKPEYEYIRWRNDEKEFARWCQGTTGYPLVDAGMRELNETGFMHNRIRMVTASFLAKHLLIDWRWGEAYFAGKLLDFDLAANNGGWQWAAGCGCDAAPYFRVFNPYLQAKKFDAGLSYIRRWVPEWEELSYPPPMVNHETARKRALDVYAAALKK